MALLCHSCSLADCIRVVHQAPERRPQPSFHKLCMICDTLTTFLPLLFPHRFSMHATFPSFCRFPASCSLVTPASHPLHTCLTSAQRLLCTCFAPALHLLRTCFSSA